MSISYPQGLCIASPLFDDLPTPAPAALWTTCGQGTEECLHDSTYTELG